jgi:hypothetical protein
MDKAFAVICSTFSARAQSRKSVENFCDFGVKID